MSFLKEQLPSLKNFLTGRLPKTLKFTWLFFVVSITFGFFLYLTDPASTDKILNSFSEIVQESGIIDESTGTISVFTLLKHNWTAMLLTVLMGFIPLLLLPALSLFSNGVLLGVMGGMYLTAEDLGLGMFLAGILPHGIFEIPAMLLSSACGVYLCLQASRTILNRSPAPMVPLITDLLRVLLFAVAPLTVAAAFVECYVTPLLLSMF